MSPAPSSADPALETAAPEKPARTRRPRSVATAVAAETPSPEAVPECPQKFAKIRTLRKGVKACGFTFGKKQIVPKVPIVHAEFLKKNAEAEILDVFEA